MWWIDRWRKSTAYTDMNAEQQGLYRNLCDEVVLREDGVIPESSLGKASGDAAAWPRNSAVVLRWMVKAKGGWTNKTALEVKARGEEISQKQRDRANARWKKDSHGNAENDAAACAVADAAAMRERMPSVSVVRSPLPEPEQRTNGSLSASADGSPAAIVSATSPHGSAQAAEAVAHWRFRANVQVRSAKVIKAYLARADARLREGATLADLMAAVDHACDDRFYTRKGYHKNPVVIWKDLGRVQQLAAWKGDGDGRKGFLEVMAEGLALPRILEPHEEAELERTRNVAGAGANGGAGAVVEASGGQRVEAPRGGVVEVFGRRERG